MLPAHCQLANIPRIECLTITHGNGDRRTIDLLLARNIPFFFYRSDEHDETGVRVNVTLH